MARNTSVRRSSSLAISAIKIMQRNLAAQPRACASRISVPAGRRKFQDRTSRVRVPDRLAPVSAGKPTLHFSVPLVIHPAPPLAALAHPASPSPLMLIQHLCHVGAAISYFQTVAISSFARGRSPAA
jgi:hypothetical protein